MELCLRPGGWLSALARLFAAEDPAPQSRAQALEAEAEKQVSEKWDRFEQRAMELIQAHEELRSLVRRDS